MQKKPDLLIIIVAIFGLGVLVTGVTASQPSEALRPAMGQMPGISAAAVKP